MSDQTEQTTKELTKTTSIKMVLIRRFVYLKVDRI